MHQKYQTRQLDEQLISSNHVGRQRSINSINLFSSYEISVVLDGLRSDVLVIMASFAVHRETVRMLDS